MLCSRDTPTNAGKSGSVCPSPIDYRLHMNTQIDRCTPDPLLYFLACISSLLLYHYLALRSAGLTFIQSLLGLFVTLFIIMSLCVRRTDDPPSRDYRADSAVSAIEINLVAATSGALGWSSGLALDLFPLRLPSTEAILRD